MNLDHLEKNLPTTPVGGESPDEVGPEIFDQLKDSQGRFRTQSLFWERRHESYPAHFTLKKHNIERDGKVYLSLYEKYMEINDPTEYQVAIRLLGSWDHWQALCNSKWFKEHVTGWREELRIKLDSQRYYEALKAASTGSLPATKFLAERWGDEEKEVKKRGRPSNEERAAHLKRIQQESEELNDDAARIGITKVA
jgi:hypothetical protein